MSENADELWQIAREGFANDAEQWLSRFITESKEAKAGRGPARTWFIYVATGLWAAMVLWSTFQIRRRKKAGMSVPGATRRSSR